MKDISDYFGSPTKQNGCNNSAIQNEKPKEKSGKDARNSNDSSTLQQSKGTEQDKSNKKKKRKKTKIRKPSDPLVKNITELLSNSLHFISSDNNSPEQSVIVAIDETASVKPHTELHDNEDCVETTIKNETADTTQSKPNAFKFLMESRNKIIGTNSPGKEITRDVPDDAKTNRDKLAARKNLLSSWSDKKGASKRKRAEDELDEVINYKLVDRARRLKKMLKVEDKSKDKVNTKRKRIKQLSISSNSEDSSNIIEVVNIETVSEDSDPTKHKISVEDASNDNVKKSKGRKSLCNFFEVVNKTKNLEQFSSADKINCEEQLEILNATDNLGKSQCKNKLNQSNTLKSGEILDEIKLTKSSSKLLGLETSITLTGEKLNTETKMSKEKRKSKRKDKVKSILKNELLDESSQESLGTPRRLRSWKMKIKINLNEQSEETDPKSGPPLKEKSVGNTLDSASEDFENIKCKQDSNAVIEIHDDDDFVVSKSCRSLKVAPVFIKATPKPKIDPKVLEARKQFLRSGMPSSLKKTMAKQQILEDRVYDIFPSISHVQQKCDSIFWSIPKPVLNLKEFLPLQTDMCDPIWSSIIGSHVNKLNIQTGVGKISDINSLINKIKKDNSDYPVFKSYRQISEKCIRNPQVEVEKKSPPKRKNKKSQKHNKTIEKTEIDLLEHAMWTEKYKPNCSEDIIGNTEAVKNLKNWLETWLNFSKEINSRRRRRASSSSEFETTDDSRDSTRLPGNTMLLCGPCGSGKTSAIYAICNELGFNIIELNASSKRTGKKLILELQEATQSHQVRKKDSTNLQNFLDTPKNEKSEPGETLSKGKMCVLLVEDIDIVFEQDDGFISSLTQLIMTSKRPIVLTTTDYNSMFVQKCLNQYEHINFLPLSTYSLATWLQILCVVEGIYVDRGDLGNLLEINKGDVRKTILELQFWVQSGGEIVKYESPLKIERTRASEEEKLVKDDGKELEENSKHVKDLVVHKNCVRSFEIFEINKPFILPYYLNLGLFWWNVPNILNIPNRSQERYGKVKSPQVSATIPYSSSCESKHFSLFNKLYEAICLVDVLFKMVKYINTPEPEMTNYVCNMKDSIELTEKMDSYIDMDFVHDITHYLVDGCIKEYTGTEILPSTLDVALPDKNEKRWRAKKNACENRLNEALSFSTRLDRKSTVLDYLPTLRGITRSENLRAANNVKRGNRFRNYLKNLGVICDQNTLRVASDILQDS